LAPWELVSGQKPATLLIPIDLFLLLCGGGDLRYPVPKWLIILDEWGGCFPSVHTPRLSFLFLSTNDDGRNDAAYSVAVGKQKTQTKNALGRQKMLTKNALGRQNAA